jgi:hypothetical protein
MLHHLHVSKTPLSTEPASGTALELPVSSGTIPGPPLPTELLRGTTPGLPVPRGTIPGLLLPTEVLSGTAPGLPVPNGTIPGPPLPTELPSETTPGLPVPSGTTPGPPAHHRIPPGPLLPKQIRLQLPAANGSICEAPAPSETTPGPSLKAAPKRTIQDHPRPAVPLRGVIPGTLPPTVPTKISLGLPFPFGQHRVTVPEPHLHRAPNKTRCLGHPFLSGQPKGTSLRPQLLPG